MAIYTNPEDLEKMRVASRLAAEVLDYIAPYVQPGVTTEELDRLCHDYMVNVQGTIPAPLNYTGGGSRPYPKSICTSVNHVVCHGIPAPKKLKKGDILNIDITVIKDGWHGDTSRMFVVGGETSILAKRLVEVTFECMWLGIAQVRPGARLGDIGAAIQHHAERHQRRREQRLRKQHPNNNCKPQYAMFHSHTSGKAAPLINACFVRLPFLHVRVRWRANQYPCA